MFTFTLSSRNVKHPLKLLSANRRWDCYNGHHDGCFTWIKLGLLIYPHGYSISYHGSPLLSRLVLNTSKYDIPNRSIIWLMVSNIFLFSIMYGMSSFPMTFIFFRGVGIPPTGYIYKWAIELLIYRAGVRDGIFFAEEIQRGHAFQRHCSAARWGKSCWF